MSNRFSGSDECSIAAFRRTCRKRAERVIAACSTRRISTDVFELMAAVPPLANIVRYGNVRGTDTASGWADRAGTGHRAICVWTFLPPARH